MFLRSKVRRKDGKQHRYRSIVENTRVAGGRVVQRHVLYLGEINDSQELAWRRSIEVLEDVEVRPRTLSLFPEDRCEGLVADASVVRVKLAELRLSRPGQSSRGSWRITNPRSRAPTPSGRNSTSSIASMPSLCRDAHTAHYDLCDRELLVLGWRCLRGAPETEVDILDLPIDLGDNLA
jgi:hypothetical protein